MSWKKGDWLPLPTSAVKDIDKVTVHHVTDLSVKVDGTEVKVAYREVTPDSSKLDVLFLHGMRFKSQTWTEAPLCTLQILGNLGYRAVAIDLPGYGDSPKPSTEVDSASFLEAVITKLKLDAPVLVSPSMSGMYALPYLFHCPDQVLTRCRGFVPVAPAQTEAYTHAMYQALSVPSLVVYGSNDQVPIGPVSLENLKHLPNSVLDIFEGRGHVCYMEDPDRFHSHLYTFLSSL